MVFWGQGDHLKIKMLFKSCLRSSSSQRVTVQWVVSWHLQSGPSVPSASAGLRRKQRWIPNNMSLRETILSSMYVYYMYTRSKMPRSTANQLCYVSHRERRPKFQSNDVSKAILGGFGCTQLGSRRFHFEELWFYHSICSCQLQITISWSLIPDRVDFSGGQREIGPGCWRNALWPSRFLGWFLGLQSWLSVQSIASHQPLRGNCWWWLN